MKKKPFWLTLIASLLLLATIPPVYSSEFAVNTVEEDQVNPAIAFNTDTDDFLVVWEDYAWKLIGTLGIAAQRIGSNGNLIGEAFPAVGEWLTSCLFQHPAIAYNPSAHEYLLVWEYGHAEDDHHIYARRLPSTVKATEDAIGSDHIHIAASTSKFESNPKVAYNPTDKEYLIVWQERNIPIGYEYCLTKTSGQRLSSNGALLGSHININTDFTEQCFPAVAFGTTNGQYLIVWEENKLDGTGETDIYGQRIGRTGALVGGKIAVSTYVYDQIKPSLAYNNKANDFLVVWEDHQGDWGDDRDILGQRVTAGGTPHGGNFLISWEGDDFRYSPDVVYNPGIDEYMVTWNYEEYYGDSSINYRRLSSSGTRIGDEEIVSSQSISQKNPTIAPNGTSYLIVWEDGRNFFTTNGIDLYGSLIKLQMLSGHVYAGHIGDESNPLSNVDMDLYCSNNYGQLGSLLSSTLTDSNGSYSIMLDNVCEYYNIIEKDPTGYISTGASSVGGRVINDNWIELTHPLSVSEMSDNDFWDISDPPPGNWTNFSPTDWVTTQSVTCAVTVEDAGSGLDVSTAQYAYNKNSSWSTWKAASCTGSDGTTSTQTITAINVPFGTDSTTTHPNRIKFRIADMSGSLAESNTFNVYIDTTGPTNPTLTADRTTHTWSGDANITMSWSGASDAASGIENYFYQWSNSPTTVPDQSLSTTTTSLSTTISSEGDSNYFHLITIDKAGNSAATAVHMGPFYLDTSPPAILSGPTVSSLTQYSALISWQTSEDSDSVLHYSKKSGRYNLQETDASMVKNHSISLTNLEPSTTYRLMVQSTDASGKKAESRGITFETLALTDNTNPTVSLIDPGVLRGIVTISANAYDDKGVECVVFFLGGDIIGIDYTPPYRIIMDSEMFTNKDYLLTAKAIDFSGRSAIDDHLKISVDNFKDMTAPTVEIYHPLGGATVSGETRTRVTVKDDSGWSEVEWFVDAHKIEGGKFPTSPLLDKEFWWDTRFWGDGKHTFAVRATDEDGKTGVDTIDVYTSNGAPPKRPKLIITEHTVTRHGNYFGIDLVVENRGEAAAYDIEIRDSLHAFQAITKTDSNADYTAKFDETTMGATCIIADPTNLGPGSSSGLYTFIAVPVLIHPNPPDPSIGDTVTLSYGGPYGTKYSESVSFSILKTSYGYPDVSIKEAHEDAVSEDDYLIVTNPKRLFSHNSNDSEVNTLLSDMARLAKERDGVLGYMDSYDRNLLRNLIKAIPFMELYQFLQESGYIPWSWLLSNKFRTTLGGYLLIVGETEIFPSWDPYGFDLHWGTTGYINNVLLSDQPYADTTGGGTDIPDIIVGRIIGNTAADLSTAINASIDGHPFDRSSALLVSGTDPDSKREKGWRNDINDYENIINSEFTVTKVHWSLTTAPTGTSIEDEKLQEFMDNAKDKDVIAYRDHGGPDGWGYNYELWSDHIVTDSFGNPVTDFSGNPVRATDFPVDLGNTNPLILSLCCLTGCYEDHHNPTNTDYHGGDDNFAEAFFDSGAAVFIGATEISFGSYNTEIGKWFFNHWDDDEDIGTVFTQIERDKWNKGNWWIYWIYEYNLYGDPKFGKLTSTKDQKQKERAKRQTPTPSLDVEIPDYVVSSRDNLDYVKIPNGDLWLEEGTYQVPFYSVSIDYPRGYRVQDVTLTNRSGLVTDTGLHLPITTMQIGAPGNKINRDQTPPEGWFPELTKQYEWKIIENPDKTTTLLIMMYPFYYNGQSTDVQFYKNYSFTIDYISSNVEITSLITDKHSYPQGDPVQINMGINNTGQAQDVIVSTVLKRSVSSTMVDSLPLSTLKDLSGYGSFSDQWDSTGFEPGYYVVKVTIKDTSNNILDKKTHMFRLGISSGEVMSLTANPGHFDAGDTISLSMTFKNTGTIPTTGTAVTRVKDKSGNTVKEFKHPVTDLTPANSITFDDTWDTTGMEEGVYSILGYVLFDSKSSEPMTVTVSSLCDGDVAPLGNRDGTVNVGDALVALRFALGLETPTQEDMGHGDVAPLDAGGQPNPDGVINVGDALVILRKALGIIGF